MSMLTSGLVVYLRDLVLLDLGLIWCREIMQEELIKTTNAFKIKSVLLVYEAVKTTINDQVG